MDVGNTVNYVCVGYGESEDPTIMWKFGEIPLTNDSSVTIYQKRVVVNNLTFIQSILELCSVRVEDAGTYFCSAVNSVGKFNSTSNFVLNVRVCTYMYEYINTTIDFVMHHAMALILSMIIHGLNCGNL